MDKITIERETLQQLSDWIDWLPIPTKGATFWLFKLTEALAAQPACSPMLTECPRCKNDIGKCDGAFAQPAESGNTPYDEGPFTLAQPAPAAVPPLVLSVALNDADMRALNDWATAVLASRPVTAAVPLTDEEIIEIRKVTGPAKGYVFWGDSIGFARAVLAAAGSRSR